MPMWSAPGVTYSAGSRRSVVVSHAHYHPPVVVDARLRALCKISHTLADDEVAALIQFPHLGRRQPHLRCARILFKVFEIGSAGNREHHR